MGFGTENTTDCSASGTKNIAEITAQTIDIAAETDNETSASELISELFQV